jgi:hypothetical protein
MLKTRYPTPAKSEDDVEYVLREHLSENDRWFNIVRMRNTAAALVRHADALEAETVTKFGPRKDETP